MSSAKEYPHAIDLCAGAGGASHGLQLGGFNVRAMFEIDPAAWYTYKVHIGDHDDMALFRRDVTDVRPDLLDDLVAGELDLLFGGPPCQPYSDNGDRDPDDPRRYVTFAAVEWVRELKPKVAVIENVEGLENNAPGAFGGVIDSLEDSGYVVRPISLHAPDFGVPQSRDRLFIVAVRDDVGIPSAPKPVLNDAGQLRLDQIGESVPEIRGYITTSEAFDGPGVIDGYELPDALPPMAPKDDPIHSVSIYDENRVEPHLCPTWMNRTDDGELVLGDHGGIDGDLLMPPNHVEQDHRDDVRERKSDLPLGFPGAPVTDRRLDPDEPAPTITCSNGTPPFHYVGKSPDHPERSVEDVRRLTVRECARLQTFPDNFCFAGTRDEQYQQVGNAVPPLLAMHLGAHIRSEVLEE